MADVLGAFGQRVQLRRQELGLQQHELGERTGFSRASIANIETGRQNVGLQRLTDLAQALETSVASLLGEGEPPQVPDVWIAQSWTVHCRRCGEVGSESTHDVARARRIDHIRIEHLSPGLNSGGED